MAYTPYYPGGWQSGEQGGTPITPAALNNMENGIAQSAVGGAGYLKTQDGTLLQWGVVDSTGSSGMTVSFDVPFVGSTPDVFITPFYNAASTIRCIYSTGGNASTQVTIYAYDVTTNAMSTATNLNFRWLAIGKWK